MWFSVIFTLHSFILKGKSILIFLCDKFVKSCYSKVSIGDNFNIIFAKAQSDQILKVIFHLIPQVFDFTNCDIRLSLWLESPAEGATS